MDTVTLSKALEDMKGCFGRPPIVGWLAAIDDTGKVRMTAGKPAEGIFRMNAESHGWKIVKIVSDAGVSTRTTKAAALVDRRDPANGKFTVRNLDRMCKCGHTFGAHNHHHPHCCYSGQNDDASDVCNCEKFRGVRAKK